MKLSFSFFFTYLKNGAKNSKHLLTKMCLQLQELSFDVTQEGYSFKLGLQGSQVFLEELNCLIKRVCFFE